MLPAARHSLGERCFAEGSFSGNAYQAIRNSELENPSSVKAPGIDAGLCAASTSKFENRNSKITLARSASITGAETTPADLLFFG
jgi:hypothetical protein